VNINRIISDDREKLASLLKTHIGVKDAEIELKEGNAEIKLKYPIPKHAEEELKKIAGRIIPGIKGVSFTIAEGKK